MAWNQPTTNRENHNTETEKEKKPKSVNFAYLCCGLLSVQGFLLGISSYLFPMPYAYNPWPVGVGHFTWSIVTATCAVMIYRRNMIAAVFAILIQLVFGLVSFDPIVSIVLSGVPLLFLLLPQSLRWMKANSHFSKIGAIVYISIVGVGLMISNATVVNEKYISDKNPIWIFSPGDTPIHPFNSTKAHVYDYWQNGALIGNCIVMYNRHNVCSEVMLNFSNRGPEKDPAFYNQILQKFKDECERRFDDVDWSVSEDKIGFPALHGRTTGGELIDIFCLDHDSVYCSLVVYDPQLLDKEAEPDHKKDKPAKSKAPPKPRYGEGLPSSYGTNKHLFYNTHYVNPLRQE